MIQPHTKFAAVGNDRVAYHVPGDGPRDLAHTVQGILIGSRYVFDERGVHELKGVPGKWPLYAVTDGSRTT